MSAASSGASALSKRSAWPSRSRAKGAGSPVSDCVRSQASILSQGLRPEARSAWSGADSGRLRGALVEALTGRAAYAWTVGRAVPRIRPRNSTASTSPVRSQGASIQLGDSGQAP